MHLFKPFGGFVVLCIVAGFVLCRPATERDAAWPGRHVVLPDRGAVDDRRPPPRDGATLGDLAAGIDSAATALQALGPSAIPLWTALRELSSGIRETYAGELGKTRAELPAAHRVFYDDVVHTLNEIRVLMEAARRPNHAPDATARVRVDKS